MTTHETAPRDADTPEIDAVVKWMHAKAADAQKMGWTEFPLSIADAKTLLARLTALEADRQRLDWLEDTATADIHGLGTAKPSFDYEFTYAGRFHYAKGLRAAIDAARHTEEST